MTNYKFNTIKEAIVEIANGRMVIVVDDEDRENEGDLLMAAEYATPEAINFMISYAKGLVCVPVTDEILQRLDLRQMVEANRDSFKTAFTVSIDAAKEHGVTTGISPAERAKSIKVFINPQSSRQDLVAPGHIFPLRAQKMGVLKRAGHTEAAVDLARLAGLTPAGVICEIIKEDGEMARVPDLFVFAKKHRLKIITIKDLIHYRLNKERFVSLISKAKMPTKYGEFEIYCYEDTLNETQHLALVKGAVTSQKSTLVRVHSECLTGDAFHSLRCDCGEQLSAALEMIEKAGTGVLLYMKQEGRGIGIGNKIKAYRLQDHGFDTVEANLELGFQADLRDYGVGAQILLDLGIKKMNLLTNNPKKLVGLAGYGLQINKRIPIIISANKHNQAYLKTKQEKLGHLL